LAEAENEIEFAPIAKILFDHLQCFSKTSLHRRQRTGIMDIAPNQKRKITSLKMIQSLMDTKRVIGCDRYPSISASVSSWVNTKDQR
jgi:hypothetical protein